MPTLNFTHIKVIVGAVTPSPCDDTIIILTDYPSPQAAVYGEPDKAEMVIRVPNSTGCDYARQHFGYEPEVVDRYGTLATQIEMVDRETFIQQVLDVKGIKIDVDKVGRENSPKPRQVTVNEFRKQVYDTEKVVLKIGLPGNQYVDFYPACAGQPGDMPVSAFLTKRIVPRLPAGADARVMCQLGNGESERADGTELLRDVRA